MDKVITKGYCFYCEKHSIKIIVHKKRKVYEWFCNSCKRNGNGECPKFEE